MRGVAVGRKAFLLVRAERAGHAVAIYCSPAESCNANRVSLLIRPTYILGNRRNRAGRPPTPDEFAELSAASAGSCAL